VGLLVTLLMTGCSGIPDSGGVQEVSGSRAEEQQPVFIDPPGPSLDATPVQIVRGFINAMRAFPVSTDKAAQFLTAESAAGWRPQRQTVIYDELGLTETANATVEPTVEPTVELSVRRSATLDARGAYTPAVDRLPALAHPFNLVREDSQWRIDNPPDALYVSADFFADYFVPLSLYFLDLSGEVLVPDPVYLPEGEQLATSLVRGLLEGPTGDLSDQVLTSVPPETRVDVSVPIRPDGVAEVGLSSQVLTLSNPQREHLAAQLVWTLRQVPGVVGVRILAAGIPLDIPGVSEVQNLNLWDTYAPFDPSANDQLFALRNDRLVVVSQTTVAAFSGIWDDGPQNLADFDVDPQFSRLAGVTGDRTRVVVGPAGDQPGARKRIVYEGGADLTDPTWNRTSTSVWVVDRRRAGSRLLVIDLESLRTRAISMGPLDRTRVTAFALSADGSRFVAIARTLVGQGVGTRRVMLGTVQTSGDTRSVERIRDVHELVTSEAVLEAPTDVGWSDPTSVSVLARIGAVSPQPYDVRIDGSQLLGGSLTPEPLLEPLLDQGNATTLATGISPDSLTYVGTNRGVLWYQDPDRQWVRVSQYPLLLPDYPG